MLKHILQLWLGKNNLYLIIKLLVTALFLKKKCMLHNNKIVILIDFSGELSVHAIVLTKLNDKHNTQLLEL